MTYKENVAYFENLTKLHVDIQHRTDRAKFFRVDMGDIEGFVKALQHFPTVVCQIPENDYPGVSLDTINRMRHCMLTFIDKCADGTDTKKKEDIYSKMEAIGEAFVGRIRNDYQNNRVSSKVMVFDPREVKCYKVGPIANGCYGMQFIIPMGEPAHAMIRMDNSKWTDL